MLTTKNLSVITFISAAVSLLLLGIWLAALANSGDTATALGFVFLLGFIYLSLPLCLVNIAGVFLAPARTWHKLLLAAIVALHLGVAWQSGFFAGAASELERRYAQWTNPALVELRRAIMLGFKSAEVAKALHDGADPNAMVSETMAMPLLHAAALKADSEAMALLLAAGAQVDRRVGMQTLDLANPRAIDVVFFANGGEPLQSLAVLLEAGAAINDHSLLLGACQRGHVEGFQRAFALPAAPTLVNVDRDNCLHLIAQHRRGELLSAISEHDAVRDWLQPQLNQLNVRGQSPLDIAAQYQAYPAALVLYRMGARSNKAWTRERLLAAAAEPGSDLAALQQLIKASNVHSGD
jgi:ankyrin repeat protein